MAHHSENSIENDANNNSSVNSTTINSPSKSSRWLPSLTQEIRQIPKFIFDPDSSLVFYWTAAVGLATLYNAWTIALRIAFPEVRQEQGVYYLYYTDMLSDFIYLMDIFMQLRTAYLQDGIPVFEPTLIRKQYISQTYFLQDVISVIPSQSILSLLPDAVGCCKYFLCTAGAARLSKLLKFHILYRFYDLAERFYDLAESFTSNPHLIRVLRLFLNLAVIIHWIACLYYLLSEYEGLGSNQWVYTNATDQQRFSRKYIICLYWSAMTLTTIGNTNSPETDIEYIFTGVIFMTGVFVFATVMGNVGDVISSMNANRQEFQARMDHIQMYLTHKKVPASLQLKIKKWAEYTWSRTKATDESRLLNMLPERLRAEVAVHVHLDSLKKVKIFEQCETGFLCELVLKLRSQVFSPGDYVCRVGETGREMFIINHGKVEVLVPSPATNKDMVVAVLSEGNYFGEISLLRLDGAQNRRTADVRSIGYSELLCLSRRDLMAALVEYPEAKSILEGQAKKRMKTNLQAQRTFSVDKLLRSSQEYSSTDSGIASRDEREELLHTLLRSNYDECGRTPIIRTETEAYSSHEVSEIKAMIQELKNANKVPGKTVWQMIARCEVLQAKLGEKEKEIEDSKHRIRELEQLLFSRHSTQQENMQGEDNSDISSNNEKTLRPSHKVTKQYSQDEGRPAIKEPSCDRLPESMTVRDRIIPDLKVTRPSETSEDEMDVGNRQNGDVDNIKTSKITNIQTKKSKIGNNNHASSSDDFKKSENSFSNATAPKSLEKNIPVQKSGEEGSSSFSKNVRSSYSSDDGTFLTETTVDHQVFFSDYEEMSLKTCFKNEIYVNDSFRYNVQTIPEENEDVTDETFLPSVPRTTHRYFPAANRNRIEREVVPDTRSLYTDLDPPADTNINTPAKVPCPNSIYRDLSQSDVEVRPGRRRSYASSSNHHTFSQAHIDQLGAEGCEKLDDYESDGAIDFLRLGSTSSVFSDESTSRRNSWSFDSENDGYSDEDGVSS